MADAAPHLDRSPSTAEFWDEAWLEAATAPVVDTGTDACGRIERVVVLNDYSVPEGGAGVLALLSARQYRRLGLPVTFITGQGGSVELKRLGVSVVALGSKGLLELPVAQALRQGYHNRQAERLIGEWIAGNDTPGTVYHLHNWSQILSPAVFRALRPVARRTLVTCHDFFNICPNGSFLHYGTSEPCAERPLSMGCLVSQCDRRNPLHKYWRTLRQVHLEHMARFADSDFTFTFIHERMRAKFLSSGFTARRTVAIPNPVEPWSRERIEAERNAGFLFVGRIGRDKGADIALAAAAQASQPITLVGAGELVPALSGLYPGARFAGWRERGEIVGFARGARALIVPSRVIEPFGLVICEAAMSGLPVVVSDRAYMAADCEAGGFGSSFSPADPDRLVELLRLIASDDALAERMSRNGFARAASLCHSPERWIESFIALFAAMLRPGV